MRGTGVLKISRMPVSMSDQQAAVSLLFPEGERPTTASVRACLAMSENFEISFEPSDSEIGGGELIWLELLGNGLTFDLVGMSPGPFTELPPQRGETGGGQPLGRVEAVTLVPGPHIATSTGSLPVLKALACLAAALSNLPETTGVAWHAARNRTDPTIFRKAIDSWAEGGVFPGLVLTSIALAPDKGLHSEGLALFTGQEIRIEPELAQDPVSATKLAVRLFDLLVGQGPVLSRENLAGPDGTPLVLKPSANQRFVRVGLA